MRLLAPLPLPWWTWSGDLRGFYAGEHGGSGLIRISARSFTKPQNMKQGRFGGYAGMRVTELTGVQWFKQVDDPDLFWTFLILLKNIVWTFCYEIRTNIKITFRIVVKKSPVQGSDSGNSSNLGSVKFLDFFSFMYDIQECFICRPSHSTVSEDAGIEPRTVATTESTVRRSNYSASSHPQFVRYSQQKRRLSLPQFFC